MCLGRGVRLCSVTEFWEVSGLKSNRERERDQKLPAFPDSGWTGGHFMTKRIPFPLCLGVHSDLRDRRQWCWVPAWCSWCVSPVAAPPSHNRYEALQGKLNNNKDTGSSSMEVLLRLACALLQNFFHKEKRWVISIGESPLKGTGGTLCQPALPPWGLG